MVQIYKILLTVFFPSAIISIGASALLIPIILKLSRKYKWYDIPDERKLHTGLIPRIGGLAIWFSILLSFSLGLIFLKIFNIQVAIPIKPILLFGVGITMIHGVGLYDDFSPLRARTKLLFQIIAALVIAIGGIRFHSIFLPLVGNIEVRFMSIPFTVFWIIGLTNALNLIDGMDGLAGGISAFCALGMAIVLLIQGQFVSALIAVSVFGATCGFLIYNWPPASIFMGDSGSHLLGFILAVTPLIEPVQTNTITSILIPITLLSIPIVDCGAAILRRIRYKRPLGKPDKEHIHHKLIALGLQPRKILLAVYIVSMCLLIVSLLLITFASEIVLYLFYFSFLSIIILYLILSFKKRLKLH